MERCDSQDNDMDGKVDEGVANTCGNTLLGPFCDNMDNDCDTLIDEGVKNAANGAIQRLRRCATDGTTIAIGKLMKA